MSDHERERGERLINELWPCPEPPPDLAARVLQAAREDAAREPTPPPVLSIVERGPVAASPPGVAGVARLERPRELELAWPPRRRGRLPLLAGVLAAAAAVALAADWWVASQRDPDELASADSGPGQGTLVASARQTVSIGTRAAAAMEAGAEVTWSVHGTRARVNQRRGSVFYRVDHGGAFRVATPAGEVEVTGTCFRVTLGATGTTLVSVLEGGVKVHTDAGELAVGVGQTARLARGQVPAVVATANDAIAADELSERVLRAEAQVRDLERRLAEAAPASEATPAARAPRSSSPAALLLPLSSRLRVYGHGLDAVKEVSLQVPGGAAVQVAHDADFKQEIFRGPARAPFITVPAPARGDLYWRLVGRPGRAGRAGHARFLADGRPATIASPHNVISDGRQSTTISFQSAPPALSLSFAATPEARRYRVRVWRAGAPARPVLERVVSEPRCSIEPGVLVEGRYLWSAQPLDAAGAALAEATANKLELAYDNALSGLAIAQPRSGQALSGSTVDVLGVAPLGARLYVNGRAAPLDDKGRFSLRVGGKPQVLVFRLLARDGAESYWVRHLRARL